MAKPPMREVKEGKILLLGRSCLVNLVWFKFVGHIVWPPKIRCVKQQKDGGDSPLCELVVTGGRGAATDVLDDSLTLPTLASHRYQTKSNYMDMVRLRSWEEYEALPVTRWNIKQPPTSQSCETALASGGLDLILVPGLGFTREGHR